MRISQVDIIPIRPRFARRYDGHEIRMRSIDQRTVFRVTCDNGVVGYGDYRCAAPPQSVADAMLGQSPFAFLRDESLPLGLGAACHDAAGKHLGIPAWQLMGSRQRQRVPVCAWTRPGPPAVMAAEIERAAAEGYLLFKVHTCQHHDLLEQHRAIDDAAPAGFRMHYDFNHNRTLAAVLPILEQLPMARVACVEDPVVLSDLEGWRRLRERLPVPVLMHVPPLNGIQEMLMGCADGYIIGEYCGGFGDALHRGFAYSKANIPSVIQLTGGSLATAFALHLGAVLPRVAHTITLDDNYEEDLAAERIPVVEGCSPVPEGPGLGVEVREDELTRLAEREPYEMPRVLGVTRFAGGRTLYSVGPPNLEREMGFQEGLIRGHRFELRQDDGSEEFGRLYARAQAEGSFFGPA